ncbi:MAG TPA: VIT domain-containing protein [Longimicrobiales bacterium]
MRWWLIPMAIGMMAAPLQAQGWIDPVRPFPGGPRVQKVRTDVTVHVNGRVANVEVEEQFRNNGPALGEADYLYPLPGEAVFSNFSLYQGEQELRGETMDAARARGIYEEIVRRKRDPALIELAGHGLLRARVFPIATGETRKITLRYTQLLARAGDALQFRYAAGAGGGISAFRLIVDDARSFGAPFSPTQEIRTQRSGNRITVTPATQLASDFDVFLPLAGRALGLTLVTHKPSSEPGFFMLTLSPGRAPERVVPRDITVVLDVSGSMSGEKIEQARAAMRAILHSLGEQDRFRLIAFSDQVRTYRADWLAASDGNVSAAEDWIDDLRAGGGTNIDGALEEAFARPAGASRLPFVIFVTDGLPSVGENNPERLARSAEQRRGRARIFAFGVGYDVNTYLLDRLSAAARGTTQYVKPGEDVERAVASLATKVRFPVLTDLRFGNAPVRLDDVYPVDLPDVFADDEVIITGRYRSSGRGTLSVLGLRAGQPQSFSVAAQFPDHELANDFIARIWASRKVGYLAQQLRLNGRNEELVNELRETALRYGILSEYTSYLVQEPMLANAPPPAAMVGRASVVAAEAAGRSRAAKSLRDVEQNAALAAQASPDVRIIAGRGFRQEDGALVDVRHRDRSTDVVVIEPFSDAYFTLLRALPELAPYWKASTSILVSGRHISIKLANSGARTVSAARTAEIVKSFRT